MSVPLSKLFFRCPLKFCSCYQVTRFYASPNTKESPVSEENKIAAWQIHEYGGLDELQPTKARAPIITKPNEIVVQVAASSVNPLDVAMVGGYGSVLLNLLRQTETCSLQTVLEFPLTLGRDFSGYVVEKGHGVHKDFEIGEEVWGVVPVHHQGCHAEKVLIDKSCVHRKPSNLTMAQAGSVLYAAMTAWSALKVSGDLLILPARGKSVLVLGGSGGVGSMAIQLLRSWGAHVVSTCRTDAIPYLESLGASVIIDYTKEDADELIKKEGRYDVILDCAGLGESRTSKYIKTLKEYSFAKLVTLKSPVLKNVDEFGLVGGMLKNVSELFLANFNAGLNTRCSTVRWGFFIPIQKAIEEITKEVEDGKLLPCIDSTFSFSQLPAAYRKVAEGHLRGKVLLDNFTKSS